MNRPLSNDQIDFFRANGFLHIPQLFPLDELLTARADSQALIKAGLDGSTDDPTYCYGRDANDRNLRCLFRINDLLAHHGHPSFKMLLAYPPLLGAVDQVVDGPFVSSVHSLVFKIPYRGYPVPWHQDPVPVHRWPVFNVDIYLDEATTDNGCLYVIPGSHLAGYHRSADFVRAWTEGRMEDAPGAIPVRTQPGDVLFHATTVLHGSFWNRSESLRRTVYFHINNLRDAKMRASDDGHRTGYLAAQTLTAQAIQCRRVAFPSELAFDYQTVQAEDLIL